MLQEFVEEDHWPSTVSDALGESDDEYDVYLYWPSSGPSAFSPTDYYAPFYGLPIEPEVNVDEYYPGFHNIPSSTASLSDYDACSETNESDAGDSGPFSEYSKLFRTGLFFNHLSYRIYCVWNKIRSRLRVARL